MKEKVTIRDQQWNAERGGGITLSVQLLYSPSRMASFPAASSPPDCSRMLRAPSATSPGTTTSLHSPRHPRNLMPSVKAVQAETGQRLVRAHSAAPSLASVKSTHPLVCARPILWILSHQP